MNNSPTIIEQVKAAIENPDLLTDDLIWRAMGGKDIEPRRHSALAAREAITATEDMQSVPVTVIDYRCPPYLTDWNLIMPEMIKREIAIRPVYYQMDLPRHWLANELYCDEELAYALWAAILADKIEKGEIR